MATTKPFSKISNNSLSLIKPKPNLPHILNFVNILEGEIDKQKWLLPLNINITVLKSESLSSTTWTDPNLLLCYDISKPPKFNMDCNFHGRILLAEAHRKHILIILIIDSWNFRKLQEWFSEFEWDENRTKKRKSNRLLIERWDFSSMNMLKFKNFISWAGGIKNEIMLFCL